MKIIDPYYEILKCPEGEECLAFLERCARTCYKSEGKINDGWAKCPDCAGGTNYPCGPDFPRACLTCQPNGGRIKVGIPSSHRLIRSILERGHESVIEHMGITVKFVIDRGISHELVRHRLCAFSQESTRYCRYDGEEEGKELTFIRPCFWEVGSPLHLRWMGGIQTAEDAYLDLLAGGAKPEEARSVLPNSLKTEIVTTANLRQWRTMFAQRCSSRAHPQMRQVMHPLLRELRTRIPLIFDDICLTDVPTDM
jgi:thymidylate synthase (FAD)